MPVVVVAFVVVAASGAFLTGAPFDGRVVVDAIANYRLAVSANTIRILQ